MPPPDELALRRQAKQFFEALRDHPFVVVVVEDGVFKVFTKSADPVLLQQIQALLEEQVV